ncbi:hypothetical protein OROMI_009861 [Orobanche minor]
MLEKISDSFPCNQITSILSQPSIGYHACVQLIEIIESSRNCVFDPKSNIIFHVLRLQLNRALFSTVMSIPVVPNRTQNLFNFWFGFDLICSHRNPIRNFVIILCRLNLFEFRLFLFEFQYHFGESLIDKIMEKFHGSDSSSSDSDCDGDIKSAAIAVKSKIYRRLFHPYMLYSMLDTGMYFVIPGSPIVFWAVERYSKTHSKFQLRKESGFDNDDLLVVILGSSFFYYELAWDYALALHYLGHLLLKYAGLNDLNLSSFSFVETPAKTVLMLYRMSWLVWD